MPKFAINYVLTPTYEIDYVIEASDEDEARRLADGLLDDGSFTYNLANAMVVTDEGDYEIGEVLELDGDTPAKVGELFFEPTNS